MHSPSQLLHNRATLSTILLISAAFHLLETKAEADYQRKARSLHNSFRRKHDTKPLQSSEDLHSRAVKCAEYYVDIGSIDHSCPHARSAGENLHGHWGRNPSTDTLVTRSVNNWYDEESKYKYRDRQTGTGHFTQLVWRDSRQLGFGIAKKGHMAVAVALYDPPGNYVGEYDKNVWRPTSRDR